MHYLRLIRWTNLLIIFLTQLLAWACVILPTKNFAPERFLLNFPNFLLVSLSTVLIAGAGYIINDYFDIRIDNINKPQKMVLEKQIPRRMAIIMHTVLNVVAVLFAAVVARQAGHYSFLLLQLICTVLLWFYSTHFKRQFALGNITVSLLTALTVIVLILYEPAMHFYLTKPPFIVYSAENILPNPIWVLMVYAYFAFVLTWMREITKDMEDLKGDEAEGCVTMPIKWGLQKASFFCLGLGGFALIPLIIAAANLLYNNDWLLGSYTVVALIIPIIAWMFFLPKAATTEHYAKASRYLKFIMVSGIGSLIIYYIEANA
ncbi:MAG TPA: geranylgeranylglycerol-phosphate geranylgeranyltransferase [Flavipsychrobacter sp.]|nr:geranylgeranylglycerol-phosphate geranylgeranyltransferase [Flavipsychrobacter sp.]